MMKFWISFVIHLVFLNLVYVNASTGVNCTVGEVLKTLVNDKIYHGAIPVNNKHFFVKIEKQEVENFSARGRQLGHATSKHGINIKDPKVLNILNHPGRIFMGKNSNGNFVDIYYKDGSVVITDAGKKNKIITAYGKLEGNKKLKGKMRKAHSVQINQWIDPGYIRIVNGREEVVGWDHSIGERYVEVPLSRTNERINHPDYPLFDLNR